MKEFEKTEISPSEYLLQRMNEGYLFHGSPRSEIIEVLEPRKASDPNGGWNSDTAVYASTHPAYAAIFALYKGGSTWSVGTVTDENGKIKSLVAKISSKHREQTEEASGRVYVLSPESFEGSGRNGVQKKSLTPVSPKENVVVGYKDFLALGGSVDWI